MNARVIFDRQFTGRWFQVYSIASDKSLSSPASFNDAYDEMERMANASGTGNGLDIREVK